MAWLYLVLAILFEVSGTTAMKLSRGFAEVAPTVAIFAFYALSLVFLTLAIRRIDISIAYAVWCALGIALVTSVGVYWFNEPLTSWKAFWLVLIVVAVVGVSFSASSAGS